MQKWKTDPKLYASPTVKDGYQVKKTLDYETTYVKEFLDSDPIRDWESIDRCRWLFNWCVKYLIDKKMDLEIDTILDCGTKDAQFPEIQRQEGYMSLGIELSESYVKYATKKGRPIMMMDVCNMTFEDNQFDFVFSHHLHGLTPDYLKALDEMYRVSKKYMVALNQVPGNPRKHYSYIENPTIFYEFTEKHNCNVLHNGYLETGIENEWVIFVEKKI
jgi:SAM-dependent methyltransferase